MNHLIFIPQHPGWNSTASIQQVMSTVLPIFLVISKIPSKSRIAWGSFCFFNSLIFTSCMVDCFQIFHCQRALFDRKVNDTGLINHNTCQLMKTKGRRSKIFNRRYFIQPNNASFTRHRNNSHKNIGKKISNKIPGFTILQWRKHLSQLYTLLFALGGKELHSFLLSELLGNKIVRCWGTSRNGYIFHFLYNKPTVINE